MSITRVDAAQVVGEEFNVTIISPLSGNCLCSFRLSADTDVAKLKQRIGADLGISLFQQYLVMLHSHVLVQDDEVLANLHVFEGTAAKRRKGLPVAANEEKVYAQPNSIVLSLVKLDYIEADEATVQRFVEAAQQGNMNLLKDMLRKPVDPDCSTAFVEPLVSSTALVAASATNVLEAVRLLCAAGANKDKADVTGTTALMAAAEEGHLEVVVLLCAEGVDKDKVEELRGVTALLLACQNEHREVARFLIEEGANHEQVDVDEHTALFCASELGLVEVVHMLCEAGADKDMVDHHGFTALIAATVEAQHDVVRVLCDAGADKDIADKWGDTALIAASEMGFVEIVRTLCEAGADKDKMGDDDKTALFAAFAEGHVEVVRVLREAGADDDYDDGGVPLSEYFLMSSLT